MSVPARPMTKSPLSLAKAALALSSRTLTPYSCNMSNHLYTQSQLFSILVLRHFFRTDYRGIEQLLQDLPELCKVLGLKRIPHFTTLQKAEQRLLKKSAANSSWTIFANLLGPPI